MNTCRLWSVTATPLLYEHMSITNDPLRARVLEAFSTGPSAHYRHLVKRLDYVCVEEPGKNGFKLLVELCNLFKELTTLVASLVIYRGDKPSPLFNALSPNLKHLYLLPQTRTTATYREELLPLYKIVDFLDKHRQLAGISLSYRFPKTRKVDPGWNSKSWPSIRTLVLQDEGQAGIIASHLPPGAFPNLQGLNVSWYASGSSELLRNIVSTHTGSSLATLSFSSGTLDPEGLSSLFQKLETLCPQVHEVHVTVTQYFHPALFDFVLGEAPQVTTVGVHLPFPMVQVHSDSEMRKMHSSAALPWTKVFPNLNVIRLMESVDFASYRKHDEVTRAKLRVPVRSAKFPIRVEDQSGCFLAEFTAGVCSLVGVGL